MPGVIAHSDGGDENESEVLKVNSRPTETQQSPLRASRGTWTHTTQQPLWQRPGWTSTGMALDSLSSFLYFFPSPQVSLGNKERSKGVFYKALQNCPWAKVSSKGHGLFRFPRTSLPSLIQLVSQGQGTSQAFSKYPLWRLRGICFLSLHWSWRFMGALL